MPDYLSPGMQLYLERLVDWDALLKLQRGDSVDVQAEVASYRTILETAAALAESFEAPARENWAAPAELTPDGGARPPAHIRSAFATLRENGFLCLSASEEYGGSGLPALLSNIVIEMVSRADASLMTLVALQAGVANDIAKYGSEEVRRGYLPRFISGELQGCMDISEPGAGHRRQDASQVGVSGAVAVSRAFPRLLGRVGHRCHSLEVQIRLLPSLMTPDLAKLRPQSATGGFARRARPARESTSLQPTCSWQT